ncbi:omega-6 fatty acid desaturase (delta-12 desaturase) [Tistlia consotensis]|uniref:Omega-6 fatty acid desaturase (Delta-12 desaturase) n=1 Tax=Tistlia consotensis USBA 355 TaxID=560819 RepID=A0A1Y6B5N1_9PROT|nr:fatty acid desaturase [Tistlia consotensis]SME88969.1 omega-6 fatty acid desaturase (delta-12 desaturase) [Tistlia consotensis USBA 355]SNR25547.1 omega-6 fatty acid desaturase (delta-12 desaturase) [Tistlia consotensis]
MSQDELSAALVTDERPAATTVPEDTRSGGALQRAVAAFQTPEPRTSIFQLACSLGGFVASCATMYAALGVSFWLTLALAPIAAGFMVRLFILQHDCGHGSFFRSRAANRWVGRLCSLLTLTPFEAWSRQHAIHHLVWNDLDRRQSGADIYSSCLTVEEYRALPAWRRLGYRAVRNPLIANLLIPPFVFLLLYRLPFDMPSDWRRERRAVYATDLALLAFYGGLAWAIGPLALAAVWLPTVVVAAIAGVWLFSVQHRFESTAWLRHGSWSYERAALAGSLHLKLPRPLQWFTANIGLHHIHHLNPRVPNYRLQACLEAIPALRRGPSMGLSRALLQWRYALWDEARQRMVPFSAARAAA